MAFVELIRSHLSANQFQLLFYGLISGFFLLGLAALVGLTLSGYIAPWTGRFYSLWDTGYAKKYIPIIASVSEHQPTAWTSFFFDLQLLVVLFPAGLYFCFQVIRYHGCYPHISFAHKVSNAQELRDEHVFVLLYAATASYFAGVMVRLMLTLTPIVCVAAAMAITTGLETYLSKPDASKTLSTAEKKAKEGKSSKAEKKKKDETASQGIWTKDAKLAFVIPIFIILVQFAFHCTWVTSNAYSSPSIVLASRRHDGSQHIIDDFREAYYWLRQNTHEKAKIMSWWDYGYQITGMSNRTVLVDNNTWNNTHIATVGKAMASPEDVSYDVMRKLDVDYVLVIFGGAIGYSGDDINKFLWMIRIGEGVYPKEVNERSFFTSRGEYRVDDQATPTMKNSLMYKLSYYRFHELFGGGPAHDSVRGTVIPNKPIKLSTVDEGSCL